MLNILVYSTAANNTNVSKNLPTEFSSASMCILSVILWASKIDFCHLERSYLLLSCVIGYNVVQWSRCELKRDLL